MNGIFGLRGLGAGLTGMVGTALLCGAVLATPSDYCEAYARDFADAGGRVEAVWQKRFDNAQEACLMLFTPQKIEQPKRRAAPAKPKPQKPVSKPVQQAAVAPVATAKTAAPQLEPGSDEWLDYCDRKYVSFNRETGTYLSRTGVERKCLVTAP